MAKFDAEISGIVAPLVTPLYDNGTLDEDRTQRLIRHVVGKKERPYIDAVFINGTTGEFPWVEGSQKKKLLDVVAEECKGRIPIVFGASGKTKEETIEMCRYGQEHDADALVIAPFYFWGSNRGMPQIVREIASSVRIPVYLYNNPEFAEIGPRKTQRNIKTGIFKRILLENENVLGIKDSSGDIKRILNYTEAAKHKKGAKVFAGDESKMMYFEDVVPSFANLDPESCKLLHEYTIDFDDRKQQQQQYINRAGEIVYCGKKKIRGGLKYALSLLGICQESVMEPGQELSAEEKSRIKKFVLEQYINNKSKHSAGSRV